MVKFRIPKPKDIPKVKKDGPAEWKLWLASIGLLCIIAAIAYFNSV